MKPKRESHIKQDPKLVEVKPVWLKKLEKRIEKGFGERCPEFCYGCATCMAWLAYDILYDLYGWKWKEE